MNGLELSPKDRLFIALAGLEVGLDIFGLASLHNPLEFIPISTRWWCLLGIVLLTAGADIARHGYFWCVQPASTDERTNVPGAVNRWIIKIGLWATPIAFLMTMLALLMIFTDTTSYKAIVLLTFYFVIVIIMDGISSLDALRR